MGTTTLNLAMNVGDGTEILTLDMDENDAAAADQHPADSELTRTHLSAQKALDFHETRYASKIKTLTGDSTKFDFSPWKGSVDLVFIDGGHDFATVKSDTENAFRLMRPDRLSCVMWHDYRNPL
ncbi:MAG TPA: class I SAM-dependent methyltransferase [Terriglobales bacterium]|nr:class I SAM-dependent methyltransferase [Terriglobales bacterium]